MVSYIARHEEALKRRHYIRHARNPRYFFDFSYRRTKAAYLDRFGDDFCLVISRSDAHDDAYVLPFRAVAALFAPEHLDERGRWMGIVGNDVIRLDPGNHCLSVAAYYNAFELLDSEAERQNDQAEPLAGRGATGGIDTSSLRARIREFNERYRATAPEKQRAISERVARLGTVADHVKRLRDHTCQLCGERGFRQANGVPYVEAHHIEELHLLLPGSYCSDNIIVVCATCHRKLHYAGATYRALDDSRVAVRINDDEYVFLRNQVT